MASSSSCSWKKKKRKVGEEDCFSQSEMAAAEQLVSLSDHSDVGSSCDGDRRSGVEDGNDEAGTKGAEVCSSSPSPKDLILKLFGNDEEEDRRNRRRRKYASLAQIYKATDPFIHRPKPCPN